MTSLAKRIHRTYLLLMLGNTLAASFIWGINTLFLLDAGLSSFEAFAANAFFTAGMVLFEIPTGIIADGWGRRTSYMLGTLTLAGSTLLYYVMWQNQAPFIGWAIVSLLLGLGFTFFSGAVEAWLVDGLAFANYKGSLEKIFGQGQMVSGIAMLSGSVAGGVIAQATNLGVPFLIRVAVLCVMFVIAYVMMYDWGFTQPVRQKPTRAVRRIFNLSIQHGLKNPPVRWVMLASPFTAGVGIYAFYAMQPYLLDLYGDSSAYSIAGAAAAIVACSQVAGGYLAPKIRLLFRKRTSYLIAGLLVSSLSLILLGWTDSFAAALFLLVLWGLVFAALMPIRQAYVNDMIPSQQRATVLSFDSLIGSTGGVVIQPALGKSADVWNYGVSYGIGAAIQLVALPFLLLSRRAGHGADHQKLVANTKGE